MLPRLTPVKSTPKRSPQAKRPATVDRVLFSAALTSGSGSLFSRSMSRLLVAGWSLSASSCAAARRLDLSAEEISTAAFSKASCALMSPSVSVFSAFSIKASLPSSAWSLSSVTALARWARSGENSFKAASADSSSRRTRLGLTTSSAPSGRVAAAPVAASVVLPSCTISALPAAIFTSSASKACT